MDNNTELSSVSDLSRTSFVVSDGYLSDDEDAERMNKEVKPKIECQFGERWTFDRTEGPFAGKKKLHCMVLVDCKGRLPMEVSERSELEEALFRIVDGKDKASIMESISK